MAPRASSSWRAEPELSPDVGLLARAEELNDASAKVQATFSERGASPRANQAWHDATVELRVALEAMYPEPFWRDVKALATGDAKAIEPALVFLETDPWCFRSGYVKADLMRYLSRIDLTERQGQRIEQILLHLVDVGDRREFGHACRLARALDSESLSRALRRRLNANEPGQRRRALQMIASLRALPLDPDELHAARELVKAEGLAQWAALEREVRRSGSDWGIDRQEPEEHNARRHHWVDCVAPVLGLDRFTLEPVSDEAGT
jgi:hypothetical protein